MCSLPALTFHSIATSHKDSLKARGGISQTLFSMMTAYTQNIGVVCSNWFASKVTSAGPITEKKTTT